MNQKLFSIFSLYCLAVWCTPSAWAQQKGSMQSYIFVSTQIPTQELIEIAAQAKTANMTLVLSGFVDSGRHGLQNTKQFVSSINQSCCAAEGPRWMIHPKLFEVFGVSSTPAFLISVKNPSSDKDFVKISGMMSVQNALKYFYEKAVNAQIRTEAKNMYEKFENATEQ